MDDITGNSFPPLLSPQISKRLQIFRNIPNFTQVSKQIRTNSEIKQLLCCTLIRSKTYPKKTKLCTTIKEVKYPQNIMQTPKNLTNKLYRPSQQKDKDTTLPNFSLFHEFEYLTEASLHV